MVVASFLKFVPTSFFIKISERNFNLVVPVTILAASNWIFSKSFFSYSEQLSQITSAYSNSGRINANKLRREHSLHLAFCLIPVEYLLFLFSIHVADTSTSGMSILT